MSNASLPLFQPEWPTAGVDEVGRGPLAGPVVTAAVIIAYDVPGAALAAETGAGRLHPAPLALLPHVGAGRRGATPYLDRLAPGALTQARAICALGIGSSLLHYSFAQSMFKLQRR